MTAGPNHNRLQGRQGADELNYTLRPDHLLRHRHVLAPDEAFGAIFTWDSVVTNARQLEHASWTQVANELDFPPPDMEDIVRAEDMPAELALTRVFYWTRDWGVIKRTLWRKQQVFTELEADFAWQLSDGIRPFLVALRTHGVKCILCAKRPRCAVERILDMLDLSGFFPGSELVTPDQTVDLRDGGDGDGFESVDEMLLQACVKAGRAPQKCVLFTNSPVEVTAAHEMSAKAVGVMGGARAAYDLKTADHIIPDYDDFVVYNVRRLFSEDDGGGMEPDLQTELELEMT